MDTDDNNSELEQLKIDRQLRRDGGGAQVVVRDPRLTSIGSILLNSLQGLVVIALCWVANNLYQVNLTLAANGRDKVALEKEVDQLAARQERNEERDDVQEARINSVENRVSTLDGRAMRGPQPGASRGH